MITIKKVKLINFTSAKELKYKFDRPGLNTIQGLNGAGKTTIFNGLMWVLYGITLKKNCSVEPWPELIDKNYEGVRGSVDILHGTKEIQIIRTSEYRGKVKGRKMKAGIMVVEDGVINDTLRNKADAQKYIQNLLGYTSELFRNSVVFGQRLKRLMEEDNATKKKIMEEAFEISFLEKAKEIANKKAEAFEGKVKELENSIMITTNSLLDKTKNFNELKAIQHKFEETRTQSIQELRANIRALKQANKELSHKAEELEQLRKKLEGLKNYDIKALRDEEFRLDMEIQTLKGKIEVSEGKIKNLKESFSNPNKTCDYCGSPLSKDKLSSYKQEITKSIKELKAHIQNNLTELDDRTARQVIVLKELYSIEEKEKKRSKLKNKIKELQESVNEYQSNKAFIKVYLQNLRKLKSQKCPVTLQQLEACQDKIQELTSKELTLRKKYKKASKESEVIAWILKDALSNGGLKSFIIESMIVYVNHELVRLKSLIGFEIRLTINLESAYKDIKIRVFNDENERPYEDLSGGQKQLVDVAIAFAMNKIVEASKPINIMLLDEVFESLDENNIEIVGKILQDKCKDKSIHLITHLKGFNPVNSYQTKVIMEDKVTKIDSKMSQN